MSSERTGGGRRLHVPSLRGLAFGRKDMGNFSASVMCPTGDAERMNLAVQLQIKATNQSK